MIMKKKKGEKRKTPQVKVEHEGSPRMPLDQIDKLKTKLKEKFQLCQFSIASKR